MIRHVDATILYNIIYYYVLISILGKTNSPLCNDLIFLRADLECVDWMNGTEFFNVSPTNKSFFLAVKRRLSFCIQFVLYICNSFQFTTNRPIKAQLVIILTPSSSLVCRYGRNLGHFFMVVVVGGGELW